MTLAPRDTHRRQRLGVIDTRVSPILISFGTPICMGKTYPVPRARQGATGTGGLESAPVSLKHFGDAEDDKPHGGLRREPRDGPREQASMEDPRGSQVLP